MNYFKQQQDLLKIEREEDKQSYLKLTHNATVSEKLVNGLIWYPIAIRGTEMVRGDYLSVEVERTTHHDLSHQLRSGVPAVFFSNHNPKEDRVEGTITYQNNNRLKITLRTDELPDWSRDGKLGIEVLFDDNSYDEMFAALKVANTMEENSEGDLLKILIGEKSPTYKKDIPEFRPQGLNPIQEKAVKLLLAANELAIVHGPPGTGKTTTLVQGIQGLVYQERKQILVLAPSNTAVDLLSEKLADAGLNVIRIGNPSRVSDRLQSLTLDHCMMEHSQMKECKKLKKQASEFKNMAHKYKRNFGKSERDQRKALFDEAHRIMKDVGKTEQYIIDDLIGKAQVITATLVGANHYTIRNQEWNTVVIDEAGQALEPACWVSLVKANKVIFAGDHCQLAPTIKSDEAARKGLSRTLMEKCVELHPESVILLEEQYRMHTKIMNYSSSVFYEGQLKAHSSVASKLMFSQDVPLLFIDTAGCGFDESIEGTSAINRDEANFLFKHLTHYIDSFSKIGMPTSQRPSIAVISPYKKQVGVLQDMLKNAPTLLDLGSYLSVNTIDSFQGQERDIVYISMTRSNAEGIIGFLSDIRRMNVAMTRAKKKLVVIGDSATLAQLSFYDEFIKYAQEIEGYHSAWEFQDL
jgi:ATP-dependent RNA/DNA helicase IGHMBP2